MTNNTKIPGKKLLMADLAIEDGIVIKNRWSGLINSHCYGGLIMATKDGDYVIVRQEQGELKIEIRGKVTMHAYGE